MSCGNTNLMTQKNFVKWLHRKP